MGFNVADILAGDSEPPTPVIDRNMNLRAWDNAPHGRVIRRYSEYGVEYVVVVFDHPGAPPSNNTEYLYLAEDN